MSIKAASQRLASDPGSVLLRRGFCEQVFACAREDVVRFALYLVPWRLRGNLEDIIHDTWCAVFRKAIQLCETEKLDTRRSETEISAYVRAIARNELRDQYTKTRKLDEKRPLSLVEGVRVARGPEKDIYPWEDLRDALHRLAPGDRQIIRLRQFEGLSFQQIGQQIGITTTAAKGRWHRAITRLRAMLGS